MKQHPKRLLSFAAIGILSIFLIGEYSHAAAAPALPKQITIATALPGSVIYTINVGMSNLVTKYTPMKCTVQPIGFVMQWAPSLKKGDVQFGHLVSSSSYAYHYGELWWKDKPSQTWMQQLTSGNDIKYGFHVRADSKIQTIRDLAGKKFYCNLVSAPSMMLFVDGIFEYYGVKHKDVKELVITSFEEAVEEVIDGRADCVITAVGLAFPKMQQAGGCRILPISKEAAEYQNKKYPFMSHAIMPAGYLGFPKETLVLTDPQVLDTSRDVPEEVTHMFLKTIYDHHDELSAIHADAKEWSLDRANKFRAIPYHSGAVKFLKEKGLWTSELEQFQKEALAKDQALKK